MLYDKEVMEELVQEFIDEIYNTHTHTAVIHSIKVIKSVDASLFSR